MDKYIEAEKRLHELLDYFDVAEAKLGGWVQVFMGKWGTEEPRRQYIPRWARDDDAAFRLMVEHGCYPKDSQYVDSKGGVELHILVGALHRERIADHPDKETAVRYAIVMAVIKKLELD